jgi:hypothetical protein
MAPTLLCSWYKTVCSGAFTPTENRTEKEKGKKHARTAALSERTIRIRSRRRGSSRARSPPRRAPSPSPNGAGGPVLRGSGAWTRARPRQPRRRLCCSAPARAPSSRRPPPGRHCRRPVAEPPDALSRPGRSPSSRRRKRSNKAITRRCAVPTRAIARFAVIGPGHSRGRELQRQCSRITRAEAASTC